MTAPTADAKPPRSPRFPTHNSPRVWLITCANSPVGISLTRHLLAHGDYITAGVQAVEFEKHEQRSGDFKAFLEEIGRTDAWKSRVRVVNLDIKIMGQCQSAIAEALNSFGRIDILFCCTSECVVGTVEELSQSPRTMALTRDQFESCFFGPVNIIKAILPSFRNKRNGHILVMTAISGHLGTPGLGIFCASQWAIEVCILFLLTG